MLNLYKMFMMIFFIMPANSQYLVGSQRDEHGCVMDGGYEWCESTSSCVRQWETPCHMIPDSNQSHPIDPLIQEPGPVIDCNPCPPPFLCPMPYMPNINMNNCKLNSYIDECGCQTRCPSYDCTDININSCQQDSDCLNTQFCRVVNNHILLNGRRTLQQSECVDKLDIGSSCGGYTPPEFQTRCLDNLECVNTMGPMVADAPGECREPCSANQVRDDNGDCVNNIPSIPSNCLTWYDGCNTCQVRNGEANMCTLMYCFVQNTPYCMTFHRDELLLNDICYRFCEDSSQSSVDLRDNCPSNTICKSTFNENSMSMISYDSCGERAWTCQMITNH